MLDREPVLKRVPEDFLVTENLVLPRASDSADCAFDYFLLRKGGYTTFEAISEIAGYLQLDGGSVGYAGLKDEDGIAEQYVCVTAGGRRLDIDGFNRAFGRSPQRFLTLSGIGTGAHPIRVGGLVGNTFRVTVRDLCAPLADRMESRSCHDCLFLNYYDTQRFGIANAPKTTHHIGAALLQGDYDRAFRILLGSGTREAQLARRFDGAARDFFETLDPRVTSFFHSSYASSRWNEELGRQLLEHGGGEAIRIVRHGIPYLFPRSLDEVVRVLRRAPELPITRYRARDGKIQAQRGLRSAVIQAKFHVAGVFDDHFHSGRRAVQLDFFLPTGCYATMAIAQFAHLLRVGCG